MVSALDYHDRSNGSTHCLYSGVSSCAFHLFYFLIYILKSRIKKISKVIGTYKPLLEVIDQAISLCKINNCHVHVAYIPLNNRKNPSKPQNADRVQTEFGAQMYQRLDKASQLKSYINLANNLDLKIVTEGVETQQEVDFFQSKECSIFQGYFFSKPLSKEDFERFIKL